MNGQTSWELTTGWKFGGEYKQGSEGPGFDDSYFETVSIPHCVVPLGWRDWATSAWQKVWIYRRPLQLPSPLGDARWVLEFAGVLTGCTVWLNGTHLITHLGGYLPFRTELTGHANPGPNLLAVVVDGRWLNVPPEGHPGGAGSVDYFEPAGIYREVVLHQIPPTSIEDVFVKGRDVLGPGRQLEVTCSISGLDLLTAPAVLRVRVLDGETIVSQAARELGASPGAVSARLVLDGLESMSLWDVDSPRLYYLEAALQAGGRTVHTARRRFGLRDARFTPEGFFLNGRRLQLRGLNRHQLFPFQGMAMPRRAQRKDAEILKQYLHCNMVRCSHYPQSSHFLDACDELGLLVWEEVPGWGYVGDDNWKAYLLRDVADMVRRDRGRPSIVVWGVRANESRNDPSLYGEARSIAHQLDGTRATSGSMTVHSTKDWCQDLFAFDDYSAVTEDDAAPLREPLGGVPYLVSEAVGALSGHPYYRRDDPQKIQQDQALLHARVMDKAASDLHYSGVLGWCGIDYASANGRTYRHLKWPGVLDTFRVPKPGASIYRSQVPPSTEVVVEPAFYWYFGEGCSVAELPEAMVCSNCEELRVFLGSREAARLYPDRQRFPDLERPPFFLPVARFSSAGAVPSDLTIEGYVEGRLVARRSFSADVTFDRLDLAPDDRQIDADGADLTRVVVRVSDRYGWTRPRASGIVELDLEGPGEIIGESRFSLDDAGPVRALWLRGRPGQAGRIWLFASHSRYPRAGVSVQVC